jgi:hypothetical protein
VSVSDHQLHSSTTSYVVGWILLFSTLALFSTIVMMCGVPDFAADAPLITLGAVATWRYSWAAINLTRVIAYQFIVFPRIRSALPAEGNASHIYVVVLSWSVGATTQSASIAGRGAGANRGRCHPAGGAAHTRTVR